MIGRIIRVFVGFVIACLAAGLTVVLFVYTPLELATDSGTDRAAEAGVLALAAATHSAVFAAPFALVGAAIGEWQRIGSWMYYALVGVVIAAIGFTAQYWTEGTGQASIVNNYAVTAFLVTGFVSGLVYWLVAGRYVRDDDPEAPAVEVIRPVRPTPATKPNGGPSARIAT
jgi:hypothetical protein